MLLLCLLIFSVLILHTPLPQPMCSSPPALQMCGILVVAVVISSQHEAWFISGTVLGRLFLIYPGDKPSPRVHGIPGGSPVPVYRLDSLLVGCTVLVVWVGRLWVMGSRSWGRTVYRWLRKLQNRFHNVLINYYCCTELKVFMTAYRQYPPLSQAKGTPQQSFMLDFRHMLGDWSVMTRTRTSVGSLQCYSFFLFLSNDNLIYYWYYR